MLSDRLRRAFYRAGLRTDQVLVCGDRKKTVIVTGEEIAKTTLRSPDIRSICENVCLMRFGNPSFVLEDGKSAFVLESLPRYTVDAVMKQRGRSVSDSQALPYFSGENAGLRQ